MASGNTDFNGIDEQEEFTDFPILPKGKFTFQIAEILEKTTAKGDPMMNIKLQCLDEGYKDIHVWDNIVIPRPGSPSMGIAGRTKHFLHCIGEECKGNFNWNSDNWAWKKVKANVIVGQWKEKDKNNISSYILDENLVCDQAAAPPGPPVGNSGDLPF